MISSMIGIDFRMTKDIDLTIKNFPLNEVYIKDALIEIVNIQIDDNTRFSLLDLRQIREEFDYIGYRARLSCTFDKTNNIIQIDITTGDIIIPNEVEYNYELLIENRSIDITCYPIETILSEKIESILSKNTANTRMKDFYDCYMLSKLYLNDINKNDFSKAIKDTIKTRKSDYIFNNINDAINLIKNDSNLQFLWNVYTSQYSYAKNIEYQQIVDQIVMLLNIANLL